MLHVRGGFRPYNDPDRRTWQDPEAVLAHIGVRHGMTFADIGCGGGFFAIPAARLVGPGGKIFGLDANPEAIAMLKEQAASEGLRNLHLKVGRGEDVVLCQHGADIVFLGLVLHDFEDAAKALQKARQTVKPAGKLINLDWKPDTPFGPPADIRFDPSKAARLITAAGFKVLTTEDSGQYHYLITAAPV